MAESTPTTPPQPRRTRSAYTYFVQENYRATRANWLRAAASGKGVRSSKIPTMVIRTLAEAWRKLPDSERIDYNQKEQADLARYQKEKVEWERHFTKTKPKRVSRRPKLRGAPKRPKSAFAFYKTEIWRDVRLDYPTLTAREAERDISRRWRDIFPIFRARYEELAVKDRDRYENEMIEFRKSFCVERQKREAEERLNRLQGQERSIAASPWMDSPN